MYLKKTKISSAISSFENNVVYVYILYIDIRIQLDSGANRGNLFPRKGVILTKESSRHYLLKVNNRKPKRC